MKQISIVMLIIASIGFACTSPKQTDETAKADSTSAPTPPPITLTKKWETEPVLTTCESVVYDEQNNVLYVSNINGAPDGKDGNGFISKVSLDGKVTEPNWIKGIDAPKGMGISNGKLYVTDIDRVHEIDIAKGKVTKSYPAQGAKFLNDIAVAGDGKVYVSDSGGGSIYVIDNGKLSKFMDNLAGPNGLFVDQGGQLLTVLWDGKTFNTIDINSKKITAKTDSIDNGDGIEALGDGSYLVSSWNGMVTYVSPDWKKTLVMDTRADSVNAADIEYVPAQHLLLVPTFFKNKVVAYEVTK